MRTLAVLLVLAAPALAADLNPYSMKVGDTGPLWPSGKGDVAWRDVMRYTVVEVGDDWLAVRAGAKYRDHPDALFVVRGVPTKGVVDDREWKPDGEWKVEGTEKYKGKTVFTLKPRRDEKK